MKRETSIPSLTISEFDEKVGHCLAPFGPVILTHGWVVGTCAEVERRIREIFGPPVTPAAPSEASEFEIPPGLDQVAGKMGGRICIEGHRFTAAQMIAEIAERSVAEFADDYQFPIENVKAALRGVSMLLGALDERTRKPRASPPPSEASEAIDHAEEMYRPDFLTERDAEELRAMDNAAATPPSESAPDDLGRKDAGHICARTACRKPEATWWNPSTRAYYCRSCALKINEYSPGLCVPPTNSEPAPAAERAAKTTQSGSDVGIAGRELPDSWGHWIDKNGNHWWIFGRPGEFFAQCLDHETGMPDDELPTNRLNEMTDEWKGNWRKATVKREEVAVLTAEVNRLESENSDYRSGQRWIAKRLTDLGSQLGLSGTAFKEFGWGQVETKIDELRTELEQAQGRVAELQNKKCAHDAAREWSANTTPNFNEGGGE